MSKANIHQLEERIERLEKILKNFISPFQFIKFLIAFCNIDISVFILFLNYSFTPLSYPMLF